MANSILGKHPAFRHSSERFDTSNYSSIQILNINEAFSLTLCYALGNKFMSRTCFTGSTVKSPSTQLCWRNQPRNTGWISVSEGKTRWGKLPTNGEVSVRDDWRHVYWLNSFCIPRISYSRMKTYGNMEAANTYLLPVTSLYSPWWSSSPHI
jgi:hypothetical protein